MQWQSFRPGKKDYDGFHVGKGFVEVIENGVAIVFLEGKVELKNVKELNWKSGTVTKRDIAIGKEIFGGDGDDGRE
jgi:hypothetical protein